MGSHPATCRVKGDDLAEFEALFPKTTKVRWQAILIPEGRIHQPATTLDVWGHALEQVLQQALDAGINLAIPDFYASYFKKAMAAGYGQQEATTIYKVIGSRGADPSSR